MKLSRRQLRRLIKEALEPSVQEKIANMSPDAVTDAIGAIERYELENYTEKTLSRRSLLFGAASLGMITALFGRSFLQDDTQREQLLQVLKAKQADHDRSKTSKLDADTIAKIESAHHRLGDPHDSIQLIAKNLYRIVDGDLDSLQDYYEDAIRPGLDARASAVGKERRQEFQDTWGYYPKLSDVRQGKLQATNPHTGRMGNIYRSKQEAIEELFPELVIKLEYDRLFYETLPQVALQK